MKKLHLNVLFFLIILWVFALLNLFQTDRPTISQLENRTLKAKPEFTLEAVFDGSYFKDLEEYYADTFIFRETWVRLANDLDSLKGFTDDTGAIYLIYNDNMGDAVVIPDGDGAIFIPTPVPTEPLAKPSSPTPDSGGPDAPGVTPSGETPDSQVQPEPSTKPEPAKETPVPTPSPEDLEPQKAGGLLIANGRAMSTHYFQDSLCRVYAETLNAFQKKLPENVKVYCLVVPTAIEFYNVEKFKDITAPQDRTITTINGYFNEAIIPVDAYTPISEHTNEYLYFRTDHHWTATGAYYAYTGFMKAIGEEPVPLSQYKTEKAEGFLGSLYQNTLNRVLQSNPDTVVMYKPFTPHEYYICYDSPVKMNLIDKNRLKEQNKYTVFMSGDTPWTIIKTDVANGKKLLVIKESYGNAFVPFLLPHFSEIYTVDPRHYKGNVLNLIEEKGIEYVLFLNNINTTRLSNYLDLITQMTQR